MNTTTLTPRCPRCRRSAVRVGPYWLCVAIGCEHLVVSGPEIR